MEIALEDAAAWVRDGGLLAYPTETVWGLGADGRSDAALARLRAFKGRASDAPVSLLVTGAAALPGLGFRLEGMARRLVADFWPGPLTLVLPCEGRFARGVARADGAVGVRCSPHPVASELADRCEREGVGPLTATSCNRSGEPAVHTRAEMQQVCADSDGRAGERRRIVAWLGGALEAGGLPGSTVVDVTGPRPAVLRWGAVPPRDLSPLLEENVCV